MLDRLAPSRADDAQRERVVEDFRKVEDLMGGTANGDALGRDAAFAGNHAGIYFSVGGVVSTALMNAASRMPPRASRSSITGICAFM